MDDLVNQLSRTLALANRFIAARLKTSGLDGIAPSHGDILAQLLAHDRLSMQDLAHAIGRDPSTVTALVKKLAAAGYVRTGKDAADRRATMVSLTERGRDLRADFAGISRELLDVQGRGIGIEEQETARRVLAVMRGNFERALRDERRSGAHD